MRERGPDPRAVRRTPEPDPRLDAAPPESRLRPEDEPCRNCADPRSGRYCPACGQRKVDVRVSVRVLVADVLEDQLVLNRALPRTVGGLLLHPGHLTLEYIRGRIVRYIAPFRLYLVSSVLFFLLMSFLGLRALDRTQAPAVATAADRDSLRAEVLRRQAALAQTDTLQLGPAPRAFIRQAAASYGSALELLADTARPLDLATYTRVSQLIRGESTLGDGELQPWAREIRLQGAPPWVEAAFDRKIQDIGHLPPRLAVRTVLADMLGYAPHAMFVLLPLYALLLKLLYFRRNRYYAEHFVFALHVHAFFFLAFAIILLSQWALLDRVLMVWMVAYMWLAMKRVYGQGWLRTSVKWLVLGWTYGFAILFAVIGTMLVALLV